MNFLSNRTQAVRIGQSISNTLPVVSGVPQGSILGPILFLIFINDLPDNINSACKIFADDTKIYSSVNTLDDSNILQGDLDELFNWSMTWRLLFNATKCVHMHMGNKTHSFKYTMKNQDKSNTVINSSKCEKDLGVYVNDTLTPVNHITEIVKKANKVLWCIKHSFSYLEQDMFITLYKSLVRPILEYASPVWSPHRKKDKLRLEQVQRRATKLIPSLRHLQYSERLRKLGLPTLVYRRDRQDLIQVYNILQNKSDQYFFKLDEDCRVRGNGQRIKKIEHYSKTIRQQFFNQRVINSWNNLPRKVVESSSLNSFKAALNQLNWHPHKFDYY